MESSNISVGVIEEITKATVLAIEKLKEVEKDSRAKTKRIKSLKVNLDLAQNNNKILQKSYDEIDEQKKVLIQENTCLKEKIVDLELDSVRKEAIAESDLRNEKITVEELRSKCIEVVLAMQESEKLNLQYKSILDEKENQYIKLQQRLKEKEEEHAKLENSLKEKEDILSKQQVEMDALNIENIKFKKMSKKYAKTVNSVSPQAVNNVRFVKKFPILESRCNSLIEKLEQTEKERDNLLSRLIAGSKRPAPTQNFSNMDRNAQLMQQFSPAARAAARQPQQHQIPFYRYTPPTTAPSSPTPQFKSGRASIQQQQPQQQELKTLPSESTIILPEAKRQKT